MFSPLEIQPVLAPTRYGDGPPNIADLIQLRMQDSRDSFRLASRHCISFDNYNPLKHCQRSAVPVFCISPDVAVCVP